MSLWQRPQDSESMKKFEGMIAPVSVVADEGKNGEPAPCASSSMVTGATMGLRIPSAGRILRQSRQKPHGRTRVVAAQVIRMLGVFRKVLPFSVRILRHAMKRKRFHALRERRVRIAILGPAIDEQQKIAPPAPR